MKRLAVIAVAVALAGTGSDAEQFPTWKVGPLPSGDALNLREGPAPSFARAGALSTGTGGLTKDVCVRYVDDPDETRVNRLPEWCLVHQGGQVLGWVAARFLVPDTPVELVFLRPWPDTDGACHVVGESAATSGLLDHTAILVGCRLGSPAIPRLLDLNQGRLMAVVADHALIAVPDRSAP